MTPDDRLERDIDYARERFMYSPTPRQRADWLRTLEALIDMRAGRLTEQRPSA